MMLSNESKSALMKVKKTRARNLRNRYYTSFKTQVSRMGLGSFEYINIFVMQYYFI